MSKSIKFFSIILIMFSIFISFYSVYASDINMNLVSNETNSNEIIEDDNSILVDDTTNDVQTQLPTDTDSLTPPSSVGTVAEEGLGLSNILSILLITVGVILILLAIAIIIRLK